MRKKEEFDDLGKQIDKAKTPENIVKNILYKDASNNIRRLEARRKELADKHGFRFDV